MRVSLVVTKVERGQLEDINTHKAGVEATDRFRGCSLTYWTEVAEAPRVGATLQVTIEEVEGGPQA